ncbi:amino acid adenylation domain-containing protein [Streptomyces sp. NPDC093595]|uniref:amino acid adenylation domain-containing protein n=1 Tax=Streptomyces sp. NPDC093595 TaxID=3366045 RepID=UPI0037F48971
MDRVDELFARQARRTPGAVALVDGDERLTYRQLDDAADRFAGALAARGVARGGRVGVYLERSAAMVVALLGTLRAGAAYVVLDPDFPAVRLRAMAADAGVRVVVDRAGARWEHGARIDVTAAGGASPVRGAGRGPDADGGRLRREAPDADAEAEAEADGREPRREDATIGGPRRAEADAACVMFTSGSTGRPKGIVASHHAVTATLTGQDFASFGPGSVWLQSAPVSWDAFALELWGPLLGGGTCVLHPGQRPDPVVMGRLVAGHGITSMYLSAGLFNVVVDEYPRALDGVREVLVGGEALSAGHVARALERWPGLRLSNGYGPVEGMVFLTTHRITAADVRDGAAGVPIGRPLRGKRVYVLDARLRPVPDGTVGELYAAGAGLALGYAGGPGATAERFTSDPYGPAGTRMYRTGDRVRRRADGVLEFVGRADAQVKVRGFRVEPGEVEAVLGSRPGVGRVAVVAREDATGERRLVAYVTGRQGDGGGHGTEAGTRTAVAAELREYAASVLPRHLVPDAVVVLDALPLTPNGKLDRAALPAPEGAASAGGGRRPDDAREQALCALFADVLGVPSVGADDDFFALGGHSLLVARLLGRIHAVLGAEVGVRTLFEAPTPAKLAPRLAPVADAPADAGPGPGPGAHPAPSAVPGAVPGGVPGAVPAGAGAGESGTAVSYAQRRLWFLDQLDAGVAYTMPMLARLRGPVDAGLLEAALGEVVARHEALRTVFGTVDGEPVPRVLTGDAARPRFTHRVVPGEELEARIGEAARYRFDLAAELPVHAVLFTVRERPDEHALLLVMHHIAADGWSLPPLFRDLSRAYAGEALPPLPVGYAEHARRRRERAGARRDDRLAHWRKALDGVRAPELPWRADDSGRADAGTVVRTLDAEAHGRLVALGREHGATLFMVLHAALAAVLVRAGAGDDTVIAAPVAGRGTDGTVDDVVGFFVNLLVLRTDASGDPALRELLARVRDTDLSALAHQDVPFEEVVDALNPVRRPGRQPFTEVVLALQNNVRAEVDLPGVDASVEVVRTGAARFGLLVDVTDHHTSPSGAPAGLAITLEYREAALGRETAEWLADAFLRMLRTAATDPDVRVSEPALPAAPRRAGAGPAAEGVRGARGASPDSGTVRRIASVWRDVLGVAEVGLHDDFFALGGNSLRAVRVAARLTGDGEGGAVTAAQIFEAPTVAALAAALEAGSRADGPAPIPRRPRVPRQRQEEPWT